ncbi:hypothetical protein SAMN04488540_12422 [Ferrimonas sediminum]|uniref:Uncharacterized protein n=1 Tax=Ferrimonas sediminum TaxID=718193 RepID=A0A1G9ALN2_9GAMM|nr:hypothetical protein [Ferrimonas sediminum]SDK28279.1 hypothetical protein SAMN04488540_12422 [Ferrimonas sediminum]
MDRLKYAADCMKLAADHQGVGNHSEAGFWLKVSIMIRKGEVNTVEQLDQLSEAINKLQLPQPNCGPVTGAAGRSFGVTPTTTLIYLARFKRRNQKRLQA